MTRFGMKEQDFQTLAQLIHDAVKGKKSVKDQVIELRKQFIEMQFCFNKSEHLGGLMEKLHALVSNR